MLFNITILTKTSGPDSWCTLDLLRQRSTISETVYSSLKFLLCCACYFRLSAYLYHNSHDDRISIRQEDERSNNIIHTDNSSSSRWFVPQELFNIYCEIMVPMKRHFANGQNRALRDLLTTKLEKIHGTPSSSRCIAVTAGEKCGSYLMRSLVRMLF